MGRELRREKTFCVYLARDEEIIKEHARLSGFPATRITEVRKMIDPTTEHSPRGGDSSSGNTLQGSAAPCAGP